MISLSVSHSLTTNEAHEPRLLEIRLSTLFLRGMRIRHTPPTETGSAGPFRGVVNRPDTLSRYSLRATKHPCGVLNYLGRLLPWLLLYEGLRVVYAIMYDAYIKAHWP